MDNPEKTDNIGYTRPRNIKQKHGSICVGHSYGQTNTNTVNIVNFVFICGHFPAAPAYEVYASQLKQYCRECASNFDLLVI
jgi:enamine deaminase RidA (YjgF/YER057c/UK114 family)